MNSQHDAARKLQPGRFRNLSKLLFFVFVGIPEGRHTAAWRRALVCFHQITWGLVNTVVGIVAGAFCVLALGGQVFRWHSATVVVLPGRTVAAVTLGPVIVGLSRLPDDVLDHEVGHWYQSIALGPLYFIVIGLPSLLHYLWFYRRGVTDRFAYFRFYTEAWADAWGGSWSLHQHTAHHWSDYLFSRRDRGSGR